jgi:hypothetical protein
MRIRIQNTGSFYFNCFLTQCRNGQFRFHDLPYRYNKFFPCFFNKIPKLCLGLASQYLIQGALYLQDNQSLEATSVNCGKWENLLVDILVFAVFILFANPRLVFNWRMTSSLVVRASDCQCTCCNGPGFDPSIRRHIGI